MFFYRSFIVQIRSFLLKWT